MAEKRLFKYVSSARICDLLNGTIRFSQPDALNDPFEMERFREQHIAEATPAMSEAPTEATLAIMRRLTTRPTDSPLEIATEAMKNLLRANSNWPMGKPQPSAEKVEAFKQKAKEITGTMKDYGILSLAQRNDDLLMWAHYADEHRGAVFEIDIADGAFRAGFVTRADSSEKSAHALNERWDDVTYLKERANPPRSPEELIVSFFLKSPQWACEQEYRIVRHLAEGRPIEGRKDRGDHEIFVFPLPPSCIKSLIFGARSTEPNAHVRDAIVEMIRDRPELRHVALQEAHLSLNTYGLEIRPLGA